MIWFLPTCWAPSPITYLSFVTNSQCPHPSSQPERLKCSLQLFLLELFSMAVLLFVYLLDPYSSLSFLLRGQLLSEFSRPIPETLELYCSLRPLLLCKMKCSFCVICVSMVVIPTWSSKNANSFKTPYACCSSL